MTKQIEARAEVGFNGDFFDFVTVSIGILNYPEPTAPVHYLPAEVDNKNLGATLRLALSASKRVPVAEFQKIFTSGVIQKVTEEQLKAAMKQYGYKTKKAMYKNMMCCWISAFDSQIEIKPTHHKSIDGYAGISNDGPEIIRLPIHVSDEELGLALREGIRRCTSAVD